MVYNDCDRVDAEEDLEALQEQTFTRVQMMQEQITGLVPRVCTHTKRQRAATQPEPPYTHTLTAIVS